MKKYFIYSIFILFIAFQSCNNGGPAEIQMVSPVQVYEAVYGEDSLQLVDVRTPEEFSVSHLKDAQNICVTSKDFEEKVANLDKGKPVYVYCKKGGRSAKAAQILKDMGFTKVYDLQGGLTSWEEEGFEMVNMP